MNVCRYLKDTSSHQRISRSMDDGESAAFTSLTEPIERIFFSLGMFRSQQQLQQPKRDKEKWSGI